MTCDVCGNEMQRVPVTAPRAASELALRERWFCTWCYAWTELGFGRDEVVRPQYQPVHRRWERAEAPELPEEPAHAYGEFGATLCGVQHENLAASPYPWVPQAPNACPACEHAATVIDERWPKEMRDRGRVQPRPPAGSSWPPF